MDFDSTLKLATIILAIIVVILFKRPKHKIDKYDLALKAAISMASRSENFPSLVLAEQEAYLNKDITTNDAKFIEERKLNREESRGLIKLKPFIVIWKSDNLHHIHIPTFKLGLWQPCIKFISFIAAISIGTIFSIYQTIYIPLHPETFANDNPIAVITIWFFYMVFTLWSLSYTATQIMDFQSNKNLLRQFFLKKN
ncbi:MAG: hypothetical protein ACJAW8_002039 [Oleispira sp.]|jgi:hypothetical protein